MTNSGLVVVTNYDEVFLKWRRWITKTGLNVVYAASVLHTCCGISGQNDVHCEWQCMLWCRGGRPWWKTMKQGNWHAIS